MVGQAARAASSAKREVALEPICAKNHTCGNTLAHMGPQLNPVTCAMPTANSARTRVLMFLSSPTPFALKAQAVS